MFTILRYFVVFAAALCPVSCFNEEEVKNGITDGMLSFYNDLETEALKENIYDYFPKEVEELVPQIQKYFMGKKEGSSTTQVWYQTHIIRDHNAQVYCIG